MDLIFNKYTVKKGGGEVLHSQWDVNVTIVKVKKVENFILRSTNS